MTFAVATVVIVREEEEVVAVVVMTGIVVAVVVTARINNKCWVKMVVVEQVVNGHTIKHHQNSNKCSGKHLQGNHGGQQQPLYNISTIVLPP